MGFLSNNFISDLFRLVLDLVYNVVGSYGWAIIIVTVLMRLAVLPLDIRQRKGMRIQQKLQPQLQAIQKKYANDQQAQQRKTQELYKEANYHPLSGCLPMIVQMVIIFAFFGAQRSIAYEQIEGMFLAAQELFPNPISDTTFEGFLWVKNLWQADTFDIGISQINSGLIPTWRQIAAYENYTDLFILVEDTYNSVMAPSIEAFSEKSNGLFILPVVATAMSFLQSKLTMSNQAAQPQQQANANGAAPQMNMKMMQYMMPVMSLIICTTTSAAYALYWTTTSLIAVISYTIMNRIFKAEDDQEAELAAAEPTTRKMERKLPKI